MFRARWACAKIQGGRLSWFEEFLGWSLSWRFSATPAAPCLCAVKPTARTLCRGRMRTRSERTVSSTVRTTWGLPRRRLIRVVVSRCRCRRGRASRQMVTALGRFITTSMSRLRHALLARISEHKSGHPYWISPLFSVLFRLVLSCEAYSTIVLFTIFVVTKRVIVYAARIITSPTTALPMSFFAFPTCSSFPPAVIQRNPL